MSKSRQLSADQSVAWAFAIVCMFVLLAAVFGDGTRTEAAQATKVRQVQADSPEASLETRGKVVAAPELVALRYPVEACKATVALMNGRDPAIIKGRKLDDRLVHVSYRRPDDNKLWQTRCEILDESRLRWAAFDAFGDGRQGRWRDEDSVQISIEGARLRVDLRQGGLAERSKSYPLSDLS